jgi:hypothetical protein
MTNQEAMEERHTARRAHMEDDHLDALLETITKLPIDGESVKKKSRSSTIQTKLATRAASLRMKGKAVRDRGMNIRLKE